MDPQEELQQLLNRQESLRQELAAKKKRAARSPACSGKKPSSARSGVQSPASPPGERKLRTRHLILMGSYLEHVTQDDPERKARLMKELDGFLERDWDRELFDLPSKAQPTGDSFAKS